MGSRDPLPPEVLADVTDLLANCPAFAGVDRGALSEVVRGAEIGRVRASTMPATSTLVVMSGAVFVLDGEGRHLEAVATGEYAALADGEAVEPVEPTLVVWLPDAARALAWRRTSTPAPRLDLETLTVRQVMSSPVRLVDGSAPCQEVAVLMRDHRISSVLVEAGGHVGIVTDRDLRTRLVAEGRSTATMVREIATVPARTVAADVTVFEALLLMVAEGIHHLPVTEGSRLVGVISSGDLHRLDAQDPRAVRVAIDRADSVAAVRAAVAELPPAVGTLLDAGLPATSVCRVVATVTDRVHQRLLRLAFDALGEPPTAYGWLVFGSQARGEQTLHTDQDTGLLLPDAITAAQEAWWAELAHWMTDALEEVGYRRCAGGVMASEPDYRLTATGWRRKIRHLLTAPTDQSVLDASIVVDVRTVAGTLDAQEVIGAEFAQAGDHPSYLAHVARACIRHRPPLGFLGRFTVERRGEHAGRLDVKTGALMPIIDLARLASLETGDAQVATAARLHAAVEAGAISAVLRDLLVEGYDLALGLRLRHHVDQVRHGSTTDDWLAPEELSLLDRSRLRATFKGVREAQQALEVRYRTALIG